MRHQIKKRIRIFQNHKMISISARKKKVSTHKSKKQQKQLKTKINQLITQRLFFTKILNLKIRIRSERKVLRSRLHLLTWIYKSNRLMTKEESKVILLLVWDLTVTSFISNSFRVSQSRFP